MAFPLRQPWTQTGDQPLVMGILNVTPDSFSDGGSYLDPDLALARAIEMIEAGADLIDVGPESTRPGANPVSAEEQIARAIPVISALRAANKRVAISIDTRLAGVAKSALDAGADLINDVSALRDDPELVEVLARANAGVILMHMRGTPANMQHGGGPQYDDPIEEISRFLDERLKFATARGVDPSRILLDPGIGFGKRVEHNLLILRHLDRFAELGQPIVLGASRKSFIGQVLGLEDPQTREHASVACAVIGAMAGVAVIRAHDVAPTVEAMRICSAVGQPDRNVSPS